jgi:Domain of unknown function (DUF3850)
MTVHKLKTFPAFFKDVYWGRKKFEVRYNDRNFQVGDTLCLQEFDGMTQMYSGQEISKIVTYILDDPRFVKEGFVVMGIK